MACAEQRWPREHWVGLAAVALVLTGSYIGLFVAPAERHMGEVQRIMYVHVPTAWAALLCFTCAFIAAIGSLWTGRERWDATLVAAAEAGVVLNAPAAHPGLALGPRDLGRLVGLGRPAHDLAGSPAALHRRALAALVRLRVGPPGEPDGGRRDRRLRRRAAGLLLRALVAEPASDPVFARHRRSSYGAAAAVERHRPGSRRHLVHRPPRPSRARAATQQRNRVAGARVE